ncbi:hypothetical protein [Gorillibacterium sp. sgz5001074]|uniref:hypothetical protein n=1 Tax=Gorillibacterium sp. sgz5001074 TaxID=3446695 RepID=UPI003F67676D
MLPLFRTTDGGVTWKPQRLPYSRGYTYGTAYLPLINDKGRGSVKADFVSEPGKETVYYETLDGGASWHSFDTASILKLDGDAEALRTVKRFADAWTAKDKNGVEEVSSTGFTDNVPYRMENGYRFYGVLPPSSGGGELETCVGLMYRTEAKIEPSEGTMAVCVKKQPEGKAWRVYMLD